MDTHQTSTVTFGDINFDEIEGGQGGLNYYSNLAVGKWGLLMTDFLYGNIDCSSDHKALVALIDSGNTTIQIPNSMYLVVMTEMRKHEKSIHSETVDGNQILVARQ